MKMQPILFVAAVAALATASQAAVTPVFQLVNPAGWTVGTPLSTSQDWAANAADRIDGVPNVSFNDAGAGLTQPTFSVASPGFIAGSGGFYSFGGDYVATASVHAPTAGAPAGAGTYVIVQTFATLNGPDSVLGLSLTDTGGTPLAGAQHLGSSVYGYDPNFPLFGGVEAHATIDEYWIPNFTGDFNAVLNMITDSSFQELRVDAILAAPSATGGTPFPLTSVPEPAACTLLATAATGVLARRRRGANA